MLLIVKSKLTGEELKRAAEDLDGYVKFVVDLKWEIMTVGGKRHVEGERLLLERGSRQSDLWGGGIDLETDQMDFDSMINIRPKDDNPSREVLDSGIRKKMEEIVRKYVEAETPRSHSV